MVKKKKQASKRSKKKLLKKEGQARKSTRGMPWRQKPKKDVTSCEKLRGIANRYRSADIRMGEPG